MDTDSGGGRDAYLLFTAAQAGTWYAAVTSDASAAGQYTLSWSINVNPFVPNAMTRLEYQYDSAGNVYSVLDYSSTVGMGNTHGATTYLRDALDRVTRITNFGDFTGGKRGQND